MDLNNQEENLIKILRQHTAIDLPLNQHLVIQIIPMQESPPMLQVLPMKPRSLETLRPKFAELLQDIKKWFTVEKQTTYLITINEEILTLFSN